jgi:hypothetical protein|eukprot:1834065-Prymnesium_polylepis.3
MLRLLLALAVGVGASLEDVGVSADPCKGLTALDAWLCAATFTIPSLSLNDGEITVSELVCQHLTLTVGVPYSTWSSRRYVEI